jgi:hypothetical protein
MQLAAVRLHEARERLLAAFARLLEQPLLLRRGLDRAGGQLQYSLDTRCAAD